MNKIIAKKYKVANMLQIYLFYEVNIFSFVYLLY